MIYIDITDTIKALHITGIQRVVANIIKYSFKLDNVAFVEYDSALQVYIVIDKSDNRIFSLNIYKFKGNSKLFLYKLIKKLFSHDQIHFVIRTLNKIISLKYYILTSVNSVTTKKFMDCCTRDDTLFLVDSCWNYHPWMEIKHAKERGVNVKQVVYDLLPIKYPDYFERVTNSNFKLWFEMIQYYCDELHAISQTTANDIRNESKFDHNKIKVMHLGSDINEASPNNIDKLDKLDKKIRFLTVSTIEPRKNHRYALKVFDELWSNGYVDIEWHIVGKEGWKSENLVKILKYHPMLEKNIFVYNYVSDQKLIELYSKSNCILIPSIDEGYGLPIVEAIKNKCDILVSDIDIFREFNFSDDKYFSLQDNGHNLKLKILQHVNGQIEVSQTENNNKIYSWKESVESLIGSL
jgi:O-antigen biosynthesis alpha-1,2-rhamnosyltransferase